MTRPVGHVISLVIQAGRYVADMGNLGTRCLSDEMSMGDAVDGELW